LIAFRDRLQHERRGKRLPTFRCVEAGHAVSIVPDNDQAIDVATLRRLVHDLREPLNAMRLGLDLLRRTLGHEDAGGEAFRDAQLKQIERLDRQVTAVNDLLARAIAVPAVRDEDATT
jgi:signal transduction histidine kinase